MYSIAHFIGVFFMAPMENLGAETGVRLTTETLANGSTDLFLEETGADRGT